MITAAVAGASGYSGAEVLRLLASRTDVRISHAAARSAAGRKVQELYPELNGRLDLTLAEPDPARLAEADVVFLALPSGEAMNVAPQILERAGHVIDLSGDFRLPSASLYREFYHRDHAAPSLLGSAVYGLPEVNADAITSARLVANPGCYPTGAILALLPALINGFVSPCGIVIDSLSGTSGAGRSASVEMSFAEVNENVRAYKLTVHQHIPEIESVLGSVSGKDVSVSFVPHLLPITRGIHTTIHANLLGTADPDEILGAYRSYYASAPFVRVRDDIPQIKDVVRTNFCDIGLAIEPRTNQLIVISVIDNLVKGAAGQAVQNMNLMFHLPQRQGLV